MVNTSFGCTPCNVQHALQLLVCHAAVRCTNHTAPGFTNHTLAALTISRSPEFKLQSGTDEDLTFSTAQRLSIRSCTILLAICVKAAYLLQQV